MATIRGSTVGGDGLSYKARKFTRIISLHLVELTRSGCIQILLPTSSRGSRQELRKLLKFLTHLIYCSRLNKIRKRTNNKHEADKQPPQKLIPLNEVGGAE